MKYIRLLLVLLAFRLPVSILYTSYESYLLFTQVSESQQKLISDGQHFNRNMSNENASFIKNR